MNISFTFKVNDDTPISNPTLPKARNVPHPVLCIMTDGMDQAHWSIPRMRGLRGPKSWGKYFRPRVKVVGVWVFFLGVYFFLGDQTQAHDSNMTIEVIARALD